MEYEDELQGSFRNRPTDPASLSCFNRQLAFSAGGRRGGGVNARSWLSHSLLSLSLTLISLGLSKVERRLRTETERKRCQVLLIINEMNLHQTKGD